MFSQHFFFRGAPAVLVALLASSAGAQSFRVQCPASTVTHPANAANNSAEPAYTGPTYPGASSNYTNGRTNATGATGPVNGAIKCQQISGGDGYATMADGTVTYLFGFGPLSGLADIANGKPGTEFPNTFNTPYPGATSVPPAPLLPGDPATSDPGFFGDQLFNYNGAIGLTTDHDAFVAVDGGARAVASLLPNGQVDVVTVTNPGSGYVGPPTVTFSPPTTPGGLPALGEAFISNGQVQRVLVTFRGTLYTSPPSVTIGPLNGCATANPPQACFSGHVDPRQIMDVGVMNANQPAPLFAIDEDDEFFLTLTNVGMIMRPDLFEQHTVHFHGYPNASAFYDGVPDASVAINIGGSFTYYYLAPDAGTYFWHCHITPPEHLQMGMVGQLYVRPRQNRVPAGASLYASLQTQQGDLRTKCDSNADILCSNPLPYTDATHPAPATTQSTDKLGNPQKYAYNDGDGSTAYDVEYPLQMHGFDPNFHFVGMTFNPEGFADMKDKYFLLNGRGYPDTVGVVDAATNQISAGPMQTPSADGVNHFSQPLNSVINIPAGGKALLRLSSLDVSEYQTLASLGIPMTVIALNAKLLRDQAGNNMYYRTNSITLGGGESLDVILDASDTTRYPSGSVYYLFTPNLDHLSNDAENFGGLMTEVRIN